MRQNFTHQSEGLNNKHRFKWLIALVLLIVSGSFFVPKNIMDFQADILSSVQAPAFNGTVMPVAKVPDWVNIPQNLWNADYDQIPADKWISIPEYNPDVLKIPATQLTWNRESDKTTFNEKVTYTVPYMGNYKFDGLEYAGSHLGIDIKLPKGTPVVAIGNGVVVNVSTGNIGFGNHIVIQHENFPSLNDPTTLTTYYSSYNHLGSIEVEEGQIVTKGQQIGLSGQSGAATIAHLHFQIDNDQAPWHPYWPFTFQEEQAAGYNDTEAVNNGLGKEKALLTTINPLLYVQEYLNGTTLTGSNTENIAENLLAENLHGSATTANQKTENTNVETEKVFTDIEPKDSLFQTLSFLKKNNIISGYPDNTFRPKIVLSRVEALKIILQSAKIPLLKTQKKSLKDVDMKEWYAEYVITALQKNIVKGYVDKTFRPLQKVTKAEFLKMLILAMNIQLSNSTDSQNSTTAQKTSDENIFADVAANAWYAPYVRFAKEKNLLDVVDDRFRPERAISRGEAATILYRILK